MPLSLSYTLLLVDNRVGVIAWPASISFISGQGAGTALRKLVSPQHRAIAALLTIMLQPHVVS
jgi:hypothetical protein